MTVSQRSDDEQEAKRQRLGRSIQSRREALGLTQAQLAERLGTHKQTVVKYEAGDIDIPTSRLEQIAVALETMPSALVGELMSTVTAQRVAEAEASGAIQGFKQMMGISGDIAYDSDAAAHEARIWLQRFVLELLELGADENVVDFAKRFLLNPHNYALFADDKRTEMSDTQKLSHMKGLAEGVRNIAKDRIRQRGNRNAPGSVED